MNDPNQHSPSAGAPPSTVEFPCQTCGRKLRVSVAYAGRPAKCPQCGGVQVVPGEGAASSAGSPSAGPTPSSVPFPESQPIDASNLLVPATSANPQQHTVSSSPFGPPTALFPPVPSAPQPSSPFGLGPPSPLIPQQPAPAAASPMRMPLSREPGRRTPTKELFDRIMGEIGKIYVGQDELVVGTLVALFSNGHVLIESVPGLGKTLFVRTLGRVLGLQFGRIQFTADLMPSDITGAPIFDMKIQEFRFRPGPVFTQLLLADEINRAPAKTHAALLEIMQEFRVTVDGRSHTLEKPFLVLATQNPIESEGTYNLPEAQPDRFMFKLLASYPGLDEEKQILQLHSRQVDINRRLEEELNVVTTPDEILKTVHDNGDVVVDDRLVDYIAKVVRATRTWPQFHLGASPRAGLAILQAARTLAAFHGRDYAVPDDVVQIAIPALRHRVILTAEAEVEGRKVDDLLQELIRSVEVPRL